LDVSPSNATPPVEVVVKLGGGVLESVEAADAVLRALRAAAQSCRLLVVPGGGPFADVVRDIDRRFGLSDDAAHWMAVLAMDQYAHLITGRLADAEMVSEPREIAGAIDAHRIPVLAPWRWLRATDPLPHSWDVTSDSIAAWVAGCVGARRLVLVKPGGVQASDAAVDRYFARALPDSMTWCIVPADRIDALNAAIGAHRSG
jgi:5-(aminomethyl)-3-furanmethanol phosphate kinase